MTSRERPYTLQIALELTGVSPQGMRHWRRVLPPLQGRAAHKECFSAGDLLALKVIQAWLTSTGGLIGHLQSAAAGLFSLCADESWPRIEQSMLAFDLDTASWELVVPGGPLRWPQGAVILPIGQLARELNEQLIGRRGEGAQKTLGFPPMPVTSEAGTARPKTAQGGQP